MRAVEVIVVLGRCWDDSAAPSEDVENQLVLAEELYLKNPLARIVLVSGGEGRTDRMAERLRGRGVPKQALLLLVMNEGVVAKAVRTHDKVKKEVRAPGGGDVKLRCVVVTSEVNAARAEVAFKGWWGSDPYVESVVVRASPPGRHHHTEGESDRENELMKVVDEQLEIYRLNHELYRAGELSRRGLAWLGQEP